MKAVKAVTWKSRNPKYTAYISKLKFFVFKDKTTSIFFFGLFLGQMYSRTLQINNST